MTITLAAPASPEDLKQLVEYFSSTQRYLREVNSSFQSPADRKLIRDGLIHFGQKFNKKYRDTGESYLLGHLIPTAVLDLKAWGIVDAEEQVALIGHDSIEDVGETEQSLKQTFNSRIARRIQGLSKPPLNGLAKNSREFSEKCIGKLETAGARVVFMKLYDDRLHNMITLWGTPEKKSWKIWETEQYYLPMGARHGYDCIELRDAIAYQREVKHINDWVEKR